MEILAFYLALILGVGPPSHHPLAYARAELEEITPLFDGRARALYGEAATKKDLLAALPGANYWHFSCHGGFNPDVPLDSALELSGPEPFTLKEIPDLHAAHNARLAVLSACQSAISDFARLPDESIGLPTGFMQAGVPGVTGTLWSVDDLFIALLIVKFYTGHLVDSLRPAEALRRAQCWLRDATNSELSELFDGYRQQAADRPSTRLAYGTAQAKFREYTLAVPGERPYASPYYWESFVFYGI